MVPLSETTFDYLQLTVPFLGVVSEPLKFLVGQVTDRLRFVS